MASARCSYSHTEGPKAAASRAAERSLITYGEVRLRQHLATPWICITLKRERDKDRNEHKGIRRSSKTSSNTCTKRRLRPRYGALPTSTRALYGLLSHGLGRKSSPPSITFNEEMGLNIKSERALCSSCRRPLASLVYMVTI